MMFFEIFFFKNCIKMYFERFLLIKKKKKTFTGYEYLCRGYWIISHQCFQVIDCIDSVAYVQFVN